jgi:hypothetical protein
MNLSLMRIAGVTIAALLLSIGYSESGVHATNSAAIGSIASTGEMSAARFDHAAALLHTGRVLIVGGIERNWVMQPTAELFDPVTGHFTVTSKPRSQHGWGVTATLLRNGKVLVAGGSTRCDSLCYTASAERGVAGWACTQSRWTCRRSVGSPRHKHTNL